MAGAGTIENINHHPLLVLSAEPFHLEGQKLKTTGIFKKAN